MVVQITIEVEATGGKTTRVKVPLSAIGATTGDIEADKAVISRFVAQIPQDNSKASSAVFGQTTAGTDSPEEFVDLQIRTSRGEVYPVRVWAEGTTASLKQLVCHYATGYARDKCQLFRDGGEELADEVVLGWYRLEPGEELALEEGF